MTRRRPDIVASKCAFACGVKRWVVPWKACVAGVGNDLGPRVRRLALLSFDGSVDGGGTRWTAAIGGAKENIMTILNFGGIAGESVHAL